MIHEQLGHSQSVGVSEFLLPRGIWLVPCGSNAAINGLVKLHDMG